MSEIFYNYLQGGKIDVGFLQGAQIDRWGNLNTTVIGDYAHPKVRLPGSGGACEIAINARRVLCIAAQSKKSFPAKIDFVTSPGHLYRRPTPGRSSACAAPARSASSPTSRSTTSTPARCASRASTPASPSTASARPSAGSRKSLQISPPPPRPDGRRARPPPPRPRPETAVSLSAKPPAGRRPQGTQASRPEARVGKGTAQVDESGIRFVGRAPAGESLAESLGHREDPAVHGACSAPPFQSCDRRSGKGPFDAAGSAIFTARKSSPRMMRTAC